MQKTIKTSLQPPKVTLHPYQQQVQDFITSRPSCAIWLDMGLGKTLSTLAALNTINPATHVLIIAPKAIAKSVWQNEIKKWSYKFRTKSLIVDEKQKTLSRKKRLELYQDIPNQPPTIYFINHELLTDLIKNTDDWYFPILVIDESQVFKSHSSKKFKALQKVLPKIKHVIELSGTPAPQGVVDLWSQIYLLDKGQRLGHNITTYRNRFLEPAIIKDGIPLQYRAKNQQAKDEIYNLISDISMSMENTLIKLPDLIIDDLEIELNSNEKQIYNTLKKEFILEFDDETLIEASHAATLRMKLAQLASGTLYINEEKDYKIVHTQKLEACKYIIENTDSNVLIAYHFQSEKKIIMDYLQTITKNARVFDGSSSMVDSWNNKEIKVLLIHPASAGHGLNLQYGGNHMIWYTLPDSLEHYLQANKRLHRQGQTKPVIITRLITKGTIDEKKSIMLNKKEINQDEILDAVKTLLIEDL